MIVLIPNPNQMLQLVKFQKAFIQNNNTKDICFYQSVPLWIPLNITTEKVFDKKDLSELSNTIEAVLIKEPKITRLSETDTPSLVCDVSILIDNKETKSTLTLCKSLNQNEVQQKKISSQEIFPMSLKIFRIGNQLQLSENSSAISDFVWKKLR